MKRELALQLLSSILPNPPWDEARSQELFRELEVLAEHKYNSYEMYQPGRLFFESLYLWLSGFQEQERTAALQFIRENLVFISRAEFQQLAQVLYHDRIHQRQLDLTSDRTGTARFRVRSLSVSPELRFIERASLYVALSDGARIDYFRRQNLQISNEQVLPTYEPSKDKIANLLSDLETARGTGARFECLFLIDDFCGSGRTLLREHVSVRVDNMPLPFEVPTEMQAYVSYDSEKRELKLKFSGRPASEHEGVLLAVSDDETYRESIELLIDRYRSNETELDGILKRLVDGSMTELITRDARIFFCPLLITQYAIDRLTPLIPRLPAPFNKLEILPGAVLPDSLRINKPLGADSSEVTMATLCEKYYRKELEDKHTGNIMYGYDNCGLPVVLHHNTPNNSIYLLWSRKLDNPLFVRYERHGREAL